MKNLLTSPLFSELAEATIADFKSWSESNEVITEKYLVLEVGAKTRLHLIYDHSDLNDHTTSTNLIMTADFDESNPQQFAWYDADEDYSIGDHSDLQEALAELLHLNILK